MRVALVTPSFGDGPSEGQLIIKRIAGALACSSDVSILTVDRKGTGRSWDGALEVIRFPGEAPSPRKKRLIANLSRDVAHASKFDDDLAALPRAIQEESIKAEGGYSPELQEHLRKTGYDRVVFHGFGNASTLWGVRSVPDSARVVLIPAVSSSPVSRLPIFDEVFARAERMIAMTEGEVRELEARTEGTHVRNVGFVVQVNTLSVETDPVGLDDRSYLVVGNPKSESFPSATLVGYARMLEKDHRDLVVILVGPGWDHFPSGHGIEPRRFGSRSDFWRWIHRAIAVLDPEPGRLVATEVLEGFLLGVPAIVAADGGAAREHCEVGNGGLWYRNYAELRGCVKALRTASVRTALGAQGRLYAEANYADTRQFINRVADAVLDQKAPLTETAREPARG